MEDKYEQYKYKKYTIAYSPLFIDFSFLTLVKFASNVKLALVNASVAIVVLLQKLLTYCEIKCSN